MADPLVCDQLTLYSTPTLLVTICFFSFFSLAGHIRATLTDANGRARQRWCHFICHSHFSILSHSRPCAPLMLPIGRSAASLLPLHICSVPSRANKEMPTGCPGRHFAPMCPSDWQQVTFDRQLSCGHVPSRCIFAYALT